MPVLDSIDNMIANSDTRGMWRRFYVVRGASSVTAALSTSGYTSGRRFPRPFIIPSVTSPVTGFYLTAAPIYVTAGSILLGLEYNMGNINVSTNAFTDGVAMPTKSIRGTSVQTGASLIYCVVTAALTGNPALTITYVNQEGTGSRTATITIPNNAVAESAYFLHPHLQSGDTGVQDITNISRSGGTGGTVTIFGLLPIRQNAVSTGLGNDVSPLVVPEIDVLCQAGEALNVYQWGATTAGDAAVLLAGVPAT